MPMFKKRFKKGEKLPRKGSSFMFYIFKKGLWQNKKKRYREVHEIKRSRNKYGSNYPGAVQEQQKLEYTIKNPQSLRRK
jgi:hypothetical protein